MEPKTTLQELDQKKEWVLYVDGSTGQQYKGVGFLLERPNSMEFAYTLKYHFTVNNDESKYEAPIGGLRMTLGMNIEQLIIPGDFKVIFDHVTGSFEVKEENMKKYSTLVKSLIVRFNTTWFEKIDRRHNKKANDLSKAIAGEQISGLCLEPLS